MLYMHMQHTCLELAKRRQPKCLLATARDRWVPTLPSKRVRSHNEGSVEPQQRRACKYHVFHMTRKAKSLASRT